jgi:hypothetical protein
MSHAGAFRTLVAVVAVASLGSCKKLRGNQEIAGFPKPVGPIHINFTCAAGAVPAIGLADSLGISAWQYETKKKDSISWVVPPNVAINSIVAKPSGTLPLDPPGPGVGQQGGAFKSKVKDSNKPDTSYNYNIEATCNPGLGAQPVHLLIDPVMIVR